MKKLLWITFGVALFLIPGCKKNDKPLPEDQNQQVELLLDKVSVTETATIQREGGNPSTQQSLAHFLPEYSSDSLLVKTTQQFEAPSGVTNYWNQLQDTYDTYEYEGGKVVKHNLFRRRTAERDAPIELLNYYLYTYDDEGSVSNISYYNSQRVPPNGDYAFRETSQTVYQYDSQQRLSGYDSRLYAYVGDGITKINTSLSRCEFQYNQDGNVEKLTRYSGFDDNSDGVVNNAEISKEAEITYTGYSKFPNPAYQSGLLTENLFSLFPFFKYLPGTANTIRFLPAGWSPSTITMTDEYTTTYREDGNLSQVQANLENKSISQIGQLTTQKRNLLMEFTYKE